MVILLYEGDPVLTVWLLTSQRDQNLFHLELSWEAQQDAVAAIRLERWRGSFGCSVVCGLCV